MDEEIADLKGGRREADKEERREKKEANEERSEGEENERKTKTRMRGAQGIPSCQRDERAFASDSRRPCSQRGPEGRASRSRSA